MEDIDYDTDYHSFDPRSLAYRRDIPHYYGDYVRQLFVATTILSLVAIPLLGDLLPFGVLAQTASALLLVLLAGLTSPTGRAVLVYDTVVAGGGSLLLELAAVNLYSSQALALFVVRELGAIMLLVAFYYGVKSVRGFSHRAPPEA